jgi:hypothetical protein
MDARQITIGIVQGLLQCGLLISVETHCVNTICTVQDFTQDEICCEKLAKGIVQKFVGNVALRAVFLLVGFSFTAREFVGSL